MNQLNKDKWANWMAMAQAGDKIHYRLLLDELRVWLMAFFKKRAHQNIVEDLVQEALISIHNKRHTFDTSRDFLPWLVIIARHKWIDKLRQHLRYMETSLDEDLAAECDTSICAKYDVANLLKILPQSQARIIEMVKLNELSIDEVANELGVSQSFVKVTIHRGIKKMQATIKEDKYDQNNY